MRHKIFEFLFTSYFHGGVDTSVIPIFYSIMDKTKIILFNYSSMNLIYEEIQQTQICLPLTGLNPIKNMKF